ncbi:ergothioneine biosynthesis protein EgtB [Pseudoxanthomonas wuyuanensis]|uniref:Ergothioneine biosynthesis protein EgtB n=2 Tax=Pseudoxanthomonas wuyuanensis TaxID=1073196 RepID=A0A286DF43_9GAMM|nr:ergothioneine biosynthesis protein EgtB [Pseudoxanthomonas wuyuanensis]
MLAWMLGSAAPAANTRDSAIEPQALLARYLAVRASSAALAAPLSAEDAMVQSMDDASPAKWHLAHTTWFFERFVLAARDGYAAFNPQWDYLFNSYYQSAGPIHARPRRGLLSRPGLTEVLDYRAEIDARIRRRFADGDLSNHDLRTLLLGTHHEQQHQELLLTDIKHAFWSNPLKPAYRDDLPMRTGRAAPLRWIAREEAIVEIGAAPWPQAPAFAYDNESPRHRVLVPAYALASRPISNGEYRQFIADGGYRTPALWMSEGWALADAQAWNRPLYWSEDGRREFTLGGWRPLDSHAPVCHLSYFEADALARWAGARLPTEAEWEQAAAGAAIEGNFADPATAALHPQALDASGPGLRQLFGDVWEWTASAYTPYPGFRALPGSLGEYNGKFMCGQWVLRGGSCVTPRDHMRASYRNFFPPPARWQFSGVRLAKDLA